MTEQTEDARAESELTRRAREVLAGLSVRAKQVLAWCAKPGGTAAAGIGSGKGVGTTCRGLERRGLVTVNRKHWRDHNAKATDLGRECARLLASGL